jgi:TIR domain
VSLLIDHFPRCTHHVFLSHTGRDKADLILPVYERLRSEGIIPWIDRHDYEYGRDSLVALGDGILNCRHVIFFLTPEMLANPKGWCPAELVYADLVQRNLRTPGADLVNVILPLIFLPNPSEALPGTVWRTLWDRGPSCRPEQTPDKVTWAVNEIRRFLRNEQRRAEQFERRCKREKTFRELLTSRPGMRERVTIFDPQPIPELPAEG